MCIVYIKKQGRGEREKERGKKQLFVGWVHVIVKRLQKREK